MQKVERRRNGRGTSTGILVLFAWLSVVNAGLSQTTVGTFVLESTATRARTGPFECRQGVPIDAGGATYILGCPNDRQVEFVAIGSGRRYGPYDFVQGRIVTIGQGVYTLVDFGSRVSTAAPLPVKEPQPAATAPAFDPAPEPVATPKPAAPAVPQTIIAPTRRGPAVAPTPVAQPSGRYSPAPPRTVPRRSRGPIFVGANIGLLDQEEYEWSVEGGDGAEDATIERTTIGLRAAGRHIGAEVGFVYDATVDATIEDSERFFYHGEASDGSGWWIGLSGDWTVWQRKGWSADIGASARYRMEEYALSYDAFQNTVIEITTTNASAEVDNDAEGDGADADSTNGVDQVTENVTVWQYVLTGDDMTLSEASLYARAKVAYESPNTLKAYAGLRVLAYSKTDVDATVRGHAGEFDLEFERTGVVSATLGISREFAGMRWHADGVVGADTRLTVGLTREF